jgi:hypothetical protein
MRLARIGIPAYYGRKLERESGRRTKDAHGTRYQQRPDFAVSLNSRITPWIWFTR